MLLNLVHQFGLMRVWFRTPQATALSDAFLACSQNQFILMSS
uniref:Uncharacterized protein n=1 Tax=Arundo donax TaxID=35708 RepID=A0A0A9EHL5_ARUDO